MALSHPQDSGTDTQTRSNVPPDPKLSKSSFSPGKDEPPGSDQSPSPGMRLFPVGSQHPSKRQGFPGSPQAKSPVSWDIQVQGNRSLGCGDRCHPVTLPPHPDVAVAAPRVTPCPLQPHRRHRQQNCGSSRAGSEPSPAPQHHFGGLCHTPEPTEKGWGTPSTPQSRAHTFQRFPHSLHSTNVVMGSSALRVCT